MTTSRASGGGADYFHTPSYAEEQLDHLEREKRRDRLYDMMARQIELRDRYVNDPDYVREVPTQMARVRLLVLCIKVEAGELLQQFNWKPWKRTKHLVDHVKVRDEISDLLHFLLELCIEEGLTADDVHALYARGSRKNHQGQPFDFDKYFDLVRHYDEFVKRT